MESKQHLQNNLLRMKNIIIIKNAFINFPISENVIILDCELVSGKVNVNDLILFKNLKISILKIEKQEDFNKIFIYIKLETDTIKISKYFRKKLEVVNDGMS